MTKTGKIAGTALVASLALGLAAPASASGWNWGHQFRQQIEQLDRQVERADRRGALSRREASELRWHVDRLEQKLRQYSYGGFTRNEVGTMRQLIGNVERRVALEIRDDNRFAGYDRRDDRHRFDGRDDRSGHDRRYERDERYDRR